MAGSIRRGGQYDLDDVETEVRRRIARGSGRTSVSPSAVRSNMKMLLRELDRDRGEAVFGPSLEEAVSRA